MKRKEFSTKFIEFMYEVIHQGYVPILDWGFRNTLVQKSLFKEGVTKCDGIVKISAHQKGVAEDVYFMLGGEIVFDWDNPKGKHYTEINNVYDKLHKIWESKYGGQKMISWDKGHFEL